MNKTREELFAGRQVETQHMMRLILREPWVLSANFHDGAVVASYPYDDYGVVRSLFRPQSEFNDPG